MRAITKGPEPPSLTEHRNASHSCYNNYQDKDVLRNALVAEQRGLCCYCMGPIQPYANKMKIEHWRCRSRYAQKQLDYSNLLGACMGGERKPREGERKPRKLEHCDTRKADADLCRNPADPAHEIEATLRYGLDGTIESDDEVFNGELNEILNLNLAFLKNNRIAVLNSLSDWWNEHPQPPSQRQIEHQRKKYDAKDGDLTPYCQVAIWWLDQKLALMAQQR